MQTDRVMEKGNEEAERERGSKQGEGAPEEPAGPLSTLIKALTTSGRARSAEIKPLSSSAAAAAAGDAAFACFCCA
jgi:hypothetical protein